MRPPAEQHLRRSESGFTLVEILVAITILLIGVLAVTTMVNFSNKSTVANNSRQGATATMRRVLETSRALPFRSVKSATLVSLIQAQSPDLATIQAGTWKVTRDNYTYTLDASVCRVDDDSDGFGVHDTADPAFCSDSTTTGTTDDRAGDYKRVTVTASWTAAGQARTAKSVTLLPPGGAGDAPVVTNVQARLGTAGQPYSITALTPTTHVFDATATNSPTSMSWMIDGTVNQTCPPNTTTCTGSGANWSFTWNIGAPSIDNVAGSVNQGKCVAPTGTATYTFDGTYQVGALPLDGNGLAGTAASTPVTINRCTPIQPPNFNATGRDKFMPAGGAAGGWVDIEWDDNPEGDIVGYKVFRGTSATNGVQICPPNATDPPQDIYNCIDRNPTAYNKNNALYYGVYAYDQSPTGAVRQGALAYVEVNTAQNSAPKAPTNITATGTNGNITVGWKIPAAPFDPDTGDTVESFRVYRRSNTGTAWDPAMRIEYDTMAALCGGSVAAGASCSFNDTLGGGTHQYLVTSVDSHLRESDIPNSGLPTA